MKLSVLMPVYNEAATVLTSLKRTLDVPIPCDFEVVVVDDGSTDGTSDILARVDHPALVRRRHRVNQGKGAAVRTAAAVATGDYMVVLDADLEYVPEEIPVLLQALVQNDATVVYGNRAFGSHNAYSFWYVMGNKVVTMWTNVLFNCYLADVETCFKLLPLALYRSLDVHATGFGMEAEVTAKLLRQGIRPLEVPITYRARSRDAGKKLTWRDGVAALWILLYERLARSRQAASPSPYPGTQTVTPDDLPKTSEAGNKARDTSHLG